MALGQHFEHRLLRKYVAVFGTLFNNVVIGRSNGTDNQFQRFKVPLEYGPREKFLAILEAKPDGKENAIQVPRMSFEMTGMEFDITRKLPRGNKLTQGSTVLYYGMPWNINYQLNIMTKTDLDATKIVEQILINFQPDYTVDVQLIDGFDHIDRIPIVYQGVSHQDMYEGNFIERRIIVWTIDFVLKGWLYGPVNERKQIKKIDVRTFGEMRDNGFHNHLTITPGLTPDGQPTTDPSETIPYQNVNEDDNWDFIIQDVDHFMEDE